MRRVLDASIPLRRLLLVLLAAAVVAGGGAWAAAKGGKPAVTAPLVRSSNAPGCVPNAGGTITIVKQGNTEKLTVSVSGMPKKTAFDVFVIQAADAPFGVSWYQGDLTTDKNGKGSQSFVGRFSIETFIVVMPPAVTSAAVSASLMPAMMTVAETIQVFMAAEVLLMNGCSAKVTALLRRPSFHWPYSIVSAWKTSISSMMKLARKNIANAKPPRTTIFIGAAKKSA